MLYDSYINTNHWIKKYKCSNQGHFAKKKSYRLLIYVSS